MASRVSALALALALGTITPAEAEDWTGAHLTFGVSGAVTNLDMMAEDLPFGGPVKDIGPYGALGYDWAVGPLTIGALIDVEATQGSADYFVAGKGLIGDSDWFMTLRGRVGVPLNDRLHVFASAGRAMMQSRTRVFPSMMDPDPVRQYGRAMGLSVEYQLRPGQHLTVEYLHTRFDRNDVTYMRPDTRSLRVGFTLRF